ncbi:Integral membrane protein [Streptomyces ambofaciens ATCC 23877]|uniref:Integral membrane protein n=1 Tax=Streptomyces ambofaciens (strain ATCC 23877 / 3486 / DSM 40053 / JCM 4204 / NBRC 12836 / NRRL B-2516) TaxID=278992 RepID=A0A0K2ANS5_STRA7|nr:hypothetical protein [Streptomyces ambofaciens]AKZ54556.1 Integral membrane protein [Streptomyces ambofaciens ATCC 23877]
MSRRRWLRSGLGVLAATQVVLGLWVLLLPELFWKWPWVSHLPPYNEHLLRDFGGASAALAVVLCSAVAAMERRLVVTALVAYLVSSVAHLLFHAQHLESLSAASGAGFMALLGTAVLLPAALLWLAADGTAFRADSPGGTERAPRAGGPGQGSGT